MRWLLGCAIMLGGCLQAPESSTARPETPRRIVSLVPAVTEMLFAMGAGDRVVAVSDFDTYPPEVLGLPTVGALVDPNLERILELEPDLVVTYGTQATLEARLGSVGIRTFPFVTASIDDMLDAMRNLGTAIGDPESGDRLATGIAASLEELRSREHSRRPTVFLVHSRDPGVLGGFFTEGGPSYFNELISIAGGENLFKEVDMKVFQPSLEEVLERDPEVIIELLPSRGGSEAGVAQRLADWRRLNTLRAVRNHRVYVLSDDYLLVVGPRLDRVAARLAEVIHPDRPEE